jgi:hypothetical protein
LNEPLAADSICQPGVCSDTYRWTTESRDQLPIDTIFYTTSVVNTPSRIEADIRLVREGLMEIALRPIRRKATETLEGAPQETERYVR